MHVLVTGGAGFIGSHLIDSLLAAGHSVVAIDNLSTGSLDNLNLSHDHPAFTFIEGDILDVGLVAGQLQNVEVVIHLAAAVGVELIVEHPVRTIETNIMGTEAVLSAARGKDCRVLLASTSEVYGKSEKIPFAEDDDLVLGATAKNRWAYAASKMVDEFLALAYAREFGLTVVPFRLFNTVGARQTGRYGMVIPRLVGQALRNEPLTVYGDGLQSRCFCSVHDVIRAISGLAIHADAPGRVYNIGCQEEISILDLAKRIIAVTASQSEIKFVSYDDAYAPGFEDMRRRVPDITRIGALLDWTPKIELDTIIRQVAEAGRT